MAKSLFKVGDSVKWVCSLYGEKPFECTGKILSLKTTVFGSKCSKLGAKVEVQKGSKYHKATSRQRTTVAVDKLQKV